MKHNKSLAFLTIFTSMLFFQTVVSMENNLLTPYAQYGTTSPYAIAIKNNLLALQTTGHGVEVYDLTKASPPYNTQPLFKASDPGLSMDFNKKGTKIALTRIFHNHNGSKSSKVIMYKVRADLEFNVEPIFKHLAEQKQDTAKFLNNNEIIFANSIINIKNNEFRPASIIKNESYKEQTYTIPLTTHPTKNHYAYYCDTLDSLFIDSNNDKDSYHFVLFILKQYGLARDIRCEIVSKIPSVQQIKYDTIRDSVHSIEYSPDGNYILLLGQNNLAIHSTKNGTVTKDNKIIKIDYASCVIFHPNSKTIFILASDRKEMIAIDIKTKKLIYQCELSNKWAKEYPRGDSSNTRANNKIFACNEIGNKIAIADHQCCQVYDIPQKLQHFFNTYDPETVPEIIIDSEKKDTALLSKVAPQSRKPKSQDNCAVQ